MKSEAQKRALAKYRKEKTKQINIRFFPKDMDLWGYLQGKDNIAEYVRQLIRDDMESSR